MSDQKTSGEPFAWYTEDYLTDKSATTYDLATMERWKAKGWPVTPMYLNATSPAALLGKGFTTLESGDGKYRIITSYQNRDDAWSDYTALCKAEQPAQVSHTMKSVMKAICSIDGFPMLTSNQCHAVAEKLNEQPAPVALALPDRDSLRDAIAQAIGGDTYDCVRVWSAWGVGTMSDDDFIPIVDHEERLYEIADTCLDELKRLNPSM
jgi:hypothetical protein